METDPIQGIRIASIRSTALPETLGKRLQPTDISSNMFQWLSTDTHIALTLVGIHLLYFSTAWFSYNFIFDKRMMRHPKFLKDQVVVGKLASAIPLKDVDAAKYDAIFYVGGHGPVIDLAVDPANIALAEKVWKAGKIVSAVCHGPACVFLRE